MSLPVTRLRRWFLGAALLMSAVVAGFYFYARWQVSQKIIKPLDKLGVNIQQSAEGFTISRSVGGRTIFTIKAKRLVQLKLSGHATLEDVQVIVYGKDSTRYDQITGKRFDYDKATGEVAAQGEVEIDLQGNAEGALAPDQALPKELKNPIHLRTDGLVFNQNSGDGYTKGRIEFAIPQATGSAVGARYSSESRSLTLESQVELRGAASRPGGASQMTAAHAVITDEPRRVALDSVKVSRGGQNLSAVAADLFLNDDNSVNNIAARGGVELAAAGASTGTLHSQQARFAFRQGVLQTADFEGDVRGNASGKQSAEGSADRLHVKFASVASKASTGHDKSSVGAESARAEGNVHLVQLPSGASRQRSDLTAPAVDFTFSAGRRLQQAATVGAGQILIDDPGNGHAGQHTAITAARLVASFDPVGHITNLHGEPESRITSTTPGQPDRVSTSNSLDVAFKPGGGVGSLQQRGNVHYQDGQREAWGGLGQYSLTDQVLTLKGELNAPPRVSDRGLNTTADQIRVSRQSGEAWAEGHVKSTYNDLKPQPDGALLATSDPIHVTAQTMHALNGTGSAEYRGAARLWQGPNVVQAPVLRFERDSRRMLAQRSASDPVTMVLLQKSKTGPGQPVNLTTDQLDYSDASRKLLLTGGVRAVSANGTLNASQGEVLLKAHASGDVATSQIEKMTLSGKVKLQQGSRTATGAKLTYEPDLGKYELSGESPCIFDSERGVVCGNLLTFFDRDDRVLVQGTTAQPAVTHTESGR